MDMISLKTPTTFILACLLHIPFSYANFTDPSDPQTAEMDKEEAHLNEQNVHLSALSEALLNLKRIHLVLIDRDIIEEDGTSWKDGQKMTDWKEVTNSMLTKLAVMVDTYLDKEREERFENLTLAELTTEMDELDDALDLVKIDQSNEKIYYNHIADTLKSVNEIIARVPTFDRTMLNSTAGIGYEETIGLVNDYAQRIRNVIYDLNNEMEILSNDKLQAVVSNLIQAIKQRNQIYALGIDQLTDTIRNAEQALNYSEFLNNEYSRQLNIANLSIAIGNAFNNGRVSKGTENYNEANLQLDGYRIAFVEEFGGIGEPLNVAQDANYSGPSLYFRELYRELKIGNDYIDGIDTHYIDITLPENSTLTNAQYLIDNLSDYIYGLVDISLNSYCSASASEERRSRVHCKIVRELTVFAGVDLTQLSSNDQARIDEPNSTVNAADIIFERIALIESKIDQVYVVND
jgi:hypothetical protein